MTAAHDAAVEDVLGNKPDDYQGWGGAGMRQMERLESSETPVRVSNFALLPAKKQRP